MLALSYWIVYCRPFFHCFARLDRMTKSNILANIGTGEKRICVGVCLCVFIEKSSNHLRRNKLPVFTLIHFRWFIWQMITKQITLPGATFFFSFFLCTHLLTLTVSPATIIIRHITMISRDFCGFRRGPWDPAPTPPANMREFPRIPLFFFSLIRFDPREWTILYLRFRPLRAVTTRPEIAKPYWNWLTTASNAGTLFAVG